jgi:alpha-beta hydrolase superfamily lysophospholipase
MLARGGQDRLIEDRAARRIQRTFRRYRQKKQAALDRRQQRLEYIKPSILTEAKREEIIEQIEKWRSERAVNNFH